MEKNINIPDHLNPIIKKVEKIDVDKYALYFDFLSIPVKVNKSYLNTIINDEDHNNQIDAMA